MSWLFLIIYDYNILQCKWLILCIHILHFHVLHFQSPLYICNIWSMFKVVRLELQSSAQVWMLFLYITRWHGSGTVVPELYKDDVKSQWKTWNSTPRHPKTPEPMTTKIGSGDYISDIYPCAKLHYDPIRGFCPPHMRSCLSDVASFLGSDNLITQRPLRRFWRSNTPKDVVSARMYFFRVPKTKIYILTTFSPKNALFGSIFDRTSKISAQNGL